MVGFYVPVRTHCSHSYWFSFNQNVTYYRRSEFIWWDYICKLMRHAIEQHENGKKNWENFQDDQRADFAQPDSSRFFHLPFLSFFLVSGCSTKFVIFCGCGLVCGGDWLGKYRSIKETLQCFLNIVTKRCYSRGFRFF